MIYYSKNHRNLLRHIAEHCFHYLYVSVVLVNFCELTYSFINSAGTFPLLFFLSDVECFICKAFSYSYFTQNFQRSLIMFYICSVFYICNAFKYRKSRLFPTTMFIPICSYLPPLGNTVFMMFRNPPQPITLRRLRHIPPETYRIAF